MRGDVTMPGVAGMQVVLMAHLPPLSAFAQPGERLLYVGWRSYAEILWVTEGALAWRGRDRRRLKREQRKFVAARRPS